MAERYHKLLLVVASLVVAGLGGLCGCMLGRVAHALLGQVLP